MLVITLGKKNLFICKTVTAIGSNSNYQKLELLDMSWYIRSTPKSDCIQILGLKLKLANRVYKTTMN